MTHETARDLVIARLRASRLQVPDPDADRGSRAGRRWAEEEAEWWELDRLNRYLGDWDEETWATWGDEPPTPPDAGGPAPEPLLVHLPRILGALDEGGCGDLELAAMAWWQARHAPPGLNATWIANWVRGALEVYRGVAEEVLAEAPDERS